MCISEDLACKEARGEAKSIRPPIAWRGLEATVSIEQIKMRPVPSDKHCNCRKAALEKLPTGIIMSSPEHLDINIGVN